MAGRIEHLPLAVAMNLLPLVGVVFAGWDVGMLLVLFWFETLVRGMANGVRHLFGIPLWHTDWRRDPRVGERLKVVANSLFVVLLYVCIVLGMSAALAELLAMVLLEELWRESSPIFWAWDHSAQLRHAVMIMAAGYLIESVIDLGKAYWRGDEWPSPFDDNDSFHKHYMIMHFSMIMSGLVAMITGTETAMVMMLMIIALKVWLDLKLARGHSLK